MVTLNLLPPTKKQEIHLAALYLMIKNFIISILLLVIFIAISLLFTKLALQNQFSQIVDQTTLTTKTGQLFNQDIKNFNRVLSQVESIQSDYTSWADFMATLSDLAPLGINFTNIYLTHTAGETKMVLTGFAQNRDQLLAFKESLEKSDLFTAVTLPLESLLKKENFPFDIKADVNNNNPKKQDENSR